VAERSLLSCDLARHGLMLFRHDEIGVGGTVLDVGAIGEPDTTGRACEVSNALAAVDAGWVTRCRADQVLIRSW
jgi:hypothetical protein